MVIIVREMPVMDPVCFNLSVSVSMCFIGGDGESSDIGLSFVPDVWVFF